MAPPAASHPAAPSLSPLEVLQSYRSTDGTLADMVASRARTRPDSIVVQSAEASWTWMELVADGERVASKLTDLGVVSGDCVVVTARNSGWHVVVLLALARLGAIMVPVNPDYRIAELSHILDHCRPRIVLYDDASEAVLSQWNGPEIVRHRLDSSLRGAGDAPPDVLADPEAIAVIIYTSGTTGAPKGVMHSQRNLVLAGEAFVERMHLQPDDRLLVILPMFHINALFYSVAGALAAGAAMVVEPRFSASRFWSIVQNHGVTQVNIIEAIAAILLQRPEAEYIDNHGLTKIYGVRDAMVAPLRARFGIPHLVGGYAMTEIPGVLNTPFDALNRPGSMGRLSVHPDPDQNWAACRVVDDAGSEVGPDETGELQVRTPIVMKGYLHDPVQTAHSFDGLWFRTGDLVRQDAEGFFYFIARRKDIIRRRGENISGAELDQVVGAHPDVSLAAAIGVPSPFGDDDILVAVVMRTAVAADPKTIVDWCRERLTAIKVPRYVVLLDELPMTPTHKVAKGALRTMAGALIARATDFG